MVKQERTILHPDPSLYFPLFHLSLSLCILLSALLSINVVPLPVAAFLTYRFILVNY